MAITINLRDFASYSSTATVTVKVDKPVAIIYGHNGVGKSTIAKALRHHADKSLGPAGSCSVLVDGLSDPEFYIYDTDYVDETFQAKEGKGIRGIFTLGKKTAEELSKIIDTETEEKTAQTLVAEYENQIESLTKRTGDATTKAKEATWSIKADFEKGPLKFCLSDRKLLADKARLFTYLHSLPKADGSHVLEELLREAKEFDDENASLKAEIDIPQLKIDEIESDPLLSLAIVGSTDSKLAPLIAKLQNESWVRKGILYPHANEDACPFCQQAMPHDFAYEIVKLFDSAYEDHCSKLKTLHSGYEAALTSFRTAIASSAYDDGYVSNDSALQSATKDVLITLERNLTAISKKISNPGEAAIIESSSALLAAWESHAERVLLLIKGYNSRIANAATAKASLDERFWERMKHEYAGALATYASEISAIETSRTALNSSLAAAIASRTSARDKLKELRKNSTNIDSSIESINRRIKSLGISGFDIEKDSSNPGYYHIARGIKGRISYKSLSEGEKTLITFLYFLESLNGSRDEAGHADKSNRIVVIDDPVSSLSHNHVYDISSLITNLLIVGKPFPQIIIMTHSLFFYHELFKSAPDKNVKHYQCFRVVKDEYSDVKPMKENDIKNDYQAYWIVLHEAVSLKKYSVALPIAMRYILEHYFSFIGYHSHLRVALLKLGDTDKEFQPFYRYINRQSHADDVNISDLASIDPAIYVEKFKQVFIQTGDTRHFDHMMGVPEIETMTEETVQV